MHQVRLFGAGVQAQREALPKASTDQEHISVFQSGTRLQKFTLSTKEKDTRSFADQDDLFRVESASSPTTNKEAARSQMTYARKEKSRSTMCSPKLLNAKLTKHKLRGPRTTQWLDVRCQQHRGKRHTGDDDCDDLVGIEEVISHREALTERFLELLH